MTNANSSRQSKLDDRIADLERVTTTLQADSAGTRADIEKLTVSFDRFVQQVSAYMQERGKPNWGWLIAAGGLILSISGLAASPYVADIGELRAQNRQVQHDLQEIGRTRWSRSDQESFRQRLDSQTTSLAASLSDASRRELEMTAGILRGELEAALAAPLQRLAQLEMEIKSRQVWVDDKTTESARHDAEIKSLQRSLEQAMQEIQKLRPGTTRPPGDQGD